PDHESLHSQLCQVKAQAQFFNAGPHKARYKEIHFADLRSRRDAKGARAWIDRFLASTSFFRPAVICLSIFYPRHFGDRFEPQALKQRRAYKKWAEMLLQPELADFTGARAEALPNSASGFGGRQNSKTHTQLGGPAVNGDRGCPQTLVPAPEP